MSEKKMLEQLFLFKVLKDVPQSVVAFSTVMLTGMLANGFIMSGGYVNGDGMTYGSYYQVGGWDISQGRWGLILFSNRFVNSWFDGLLALGVLAVAAIFTLKVLQIKSVVASIGISMLLATQTHFSQWQGSTYILFPYATAVLCAILSVWLCKRAAKNIKGVLHFGSAVLLLAFSLGIYQAYLAVAITLILLDIICDFASQNSVKVVLYRCLRYLGMGIMGGALYYLIMIAALQFYGVQMTSARGWADAMSGNIAIVMAPGYTLKSIYKLFAQMFFYDGIRNYSFLHKTVYILLFGIFFFGLINWSISVRKKVVNGIAVWLGIFCAPVAVLMVRIITVTVIPWSMYPAVIFIPVGIIAFLDKVYDSIKWNIYMQWVLAACCIFLILESMYISNVEYNNLQKRNAKTFAAAIRILDTVETVEGYEKGMPVIFIGNMGDTYVNPLKQYEEELYGYEAYIMDYLPFHNTSSYGWHKYIKDNLGVVLEEPSDYLELYQRIADMEWFASMEVFPEDGCTYVYDGVLVVKLSEPQ